MNHNLAFDFSVNKEEKTITVTREFAAERSLIWDAYTKSELLDQWWAPKPWKARTKFMDFKEGGYWLYAMTGPDGEEHWSYAKYTDVHPKERYAGYDGFCDSEGNKKADMPQSKWEVSFTDKEDNTLVKFHILYDQLQQLEATLDMGFREGLSMAMNGLDELLLTLKK
jgi:uncharacterized protein YndB with AHSA1/START domain